MTEPWHWTPRTQLYATVAGLVALAGFGIALFGGFIPGLAPNFSNPSVVSLDGHEFYREVVTVPQPVLGTNYSTPEAVAFHSVTFWIWVVNWYSAEGGAVVGNATLSNGTAYPFALGSVGSPPEEVTEFLAPADAAAAAWNGGPLLELLSPV